VFDTSFLSHALVPSQQSAAALTTLGRSLTSNATRFVPSFALIEFGSLLRKAATRGSLSSAEANRLFAVAMAAADVAQVEPSVLQSAYVLATRINQPDTFDTTGYALAQSLNAEFWVSDRRFYNAATAAGLSGISIFD